MKLIRFAHAGLALAATAIFTVQANAQPAPTTGKIPAQTPPPRMISPNGGPNGMAPRMPAAPVAMPPKDKVSYILGANFGEAVKKNELEIDPEIYLQGLKDALIGTNKYTPEEAKEIFTQFQGAMRSKAQALREKQMKEMQAKAEENKAKGAEYLAKHEKMDGVKTLTNGIQYKVLKEGTGPMPKPTDSVTVAYKGSLIDGSTFDSNPHFETAVTGRTIKGWSEVLPLMKVGSKWEVTIPSDLGYGARGFGQKIGPSEVLIFEMELLDVKPGAAPTMTTPAPQAKGPDGKPLSMTVPTGSNLPPTPSGNGVVSGQIIKVPSKADLDKGAKIEVITNVPPQ